MKSRMLYPIGIQTFERIRQDGYVYVDKTSLIYELVSTGVYYFLSRPRRFGKSLLLSTLEAYFQGRKELFEGLAISALEKEWKSYPIIHFDLNVGKYDSPQSIYEVLDDQLARYEQVYSRNPGSSELGLRFRWIVEKAAERTHSKVVILVDEYEKPLLQALGHESLMTDFRAELKAFYGVLKTCDRHIQFAFLTGITKLGRMSVFSDLNNLQDISMSPRYADICGITRAEMLEYFQSPISEMANKAQISFEDMMEILRLNYNGYRFSESEVSVANPFSVLNVLQNQTISDYWFATGTPSFLARELHKCGTNLWSLDAVKIRADKLQEIDSVAHNPIPLIYQSGYLTIKDFNSVFRTYLLGFPNEEVKRGFINFLMPYYAGAKVEDQFDVEGLVEAVDNGDVDGIMERLKAIFADIPYIEQKDFDYESEFRNVMYLVLSILGFYVQAEKHLSRGRIDLMILTKKYAYIMEFKTNKDAMEALKQIDEKGYDWSFKTGHRRLIKVGVNFDTEIRNISSWTVEIE